MMDQQANTTKPFRYTTSAQKDQVSPNLKDFNSPTVSPFTAGSPVDLSIVDTFMNEEGMKSRKSPSRYASPKSSPTHSSKPMEAFAAKDKKEHLRMREGGLRTSDYEVRAYTAKCVRRKQPRNSHYARRSISSARWTAP